MLEKWFTLVVVLMLLSFNENGSNASMSNSVVDAPNVRQVAQATENIFCPSEFEYDKTQRLCVSETEALGPFTNEMIAKCKQFGGGPACEGTRWEVNFARKLRGTNTCPPGAKLDSGIGQCVDGANVYGPFTSVMVEKCKMFGGGPACETMRLSRSFFPSSGSSTTAFDFPAPTDAVRDRTFTLWATYYYVHKAQDTPNGFPLLDTLGNRLGPKLSKRDWCNAAVEGTVQVTDVSGVPKTYNYAGKGSTQQVDCSSFFPRLPPSVVRGTNRVRFKVSSGLYGEGTDGLVLVPYRTIAVDRAVIPIGSVIYIPDARGKGITLPSGETVTHDGYFYTADVGGAIEENQIDVFLGISKQNPFPFIKSTDSGTFTAFLIRDTQITEALKIPHQK